MGFGGLIDERIKEGGNHSELAKRIPWHPYWRSVWLRLRPPKLIETRYLELFDHINYKAIGLVLSEI